MKRDECLALLQKMSWVPCEESRGPPQYRAMAAYHCTFCAYTVCVRCYNAIPTALLFPSSGASAVDANEMPLEMQKGSPPADDNSLQAGDMPSHKAWADEEFKKPRCFLCRGGDLIWEGVPVFEWTCEGPRPSRRLQRGSLVSYDVDVVQRYYAMREQRDKRADSKAPLVAQFHGAEGPLRHFVFANRIGAAGSDAAVTTDIVGNGVVDRRPFCEEGSCFYFSVQNPRLEVSCVWCAVNRRLSEAHPSLVGEETITPLETFRCPPSLPGLPAQRFRVSVPYGAYGLHNVHALALCLTDDIFQKAPTKSQLTGETVTEIGGQQSRRGQPRAGKGPPCHFLRPLLVVDVLHRVATGNPVRDLLGAQWLAMCVQDVHGEASVPPKTCNTLIPTITTDNACASKSSIVGDGDSKDKDDTAVFHNDDDDNSTFLVHDKEQDDAPTAWPGDLRCDELLLTVDYLLQGRSVAVYGIASKYFFLQHVLQCAEFRHHGIVVVDAYHAAPTRIAHQLREVEKHLRQLQQRAERELLQSTVAHGAGNGPLDRDNRSLSPERGQPTPPPAEQPQYYSVDSSRATSPVRSQSYRTPLRSRAMGEGLSQSFKRGADNAADDGLNTLAQCQLGNTPPPSAALGCVSLCSSTPLQKKRGSSIILVNGDEGLGLLTPKPQVQGTRYPDRSQPRQRETEGGHSFFRHKTGIEESVRAWSRRYCLRENSEWNYDVSVRDDYRGKRPREVLEREKRDSNNETDDAEDEKSVSTAFMDHRSSRSPRFIVSSSELMRSLLLACRAPLRTCVEWISLPSLTARSLIPTAQSNIVLCPPLPRSGTRITIIVVHGIDQLDVPALFELQTIAREHPYRVLLLCSFDNPNWMLSSGAALLNSYRLASVQLHSLLLPRVHEMSTMNSLSLLTEMEAFAAGGGKFGRYTNRTGAFSAGAALPLYDTIRRILFSLPATFSELLRCMIARQEASGENVFVPMSLHQEHFDERGMMVSMARLKAIERELTSNRLAVFNSAENKLMIPQHRKLLRVLEEVLEQRRTVESTAGEAAPVEA